MTEKLTHLFNNNRAWADALKKNDPQFFQRLAAQQSPKYLWIGCSDSRVPANEIVGLLPGELFVHRNVANLVVHTDLNCLSVIQFAVDWLKVEHIIVTGHYGCGGVRAVVEQRELGLVDNWLRHLADIRDRIPDELAALPSVDERTDRLCEFNVKEQVLNVCESTVVQNAWKEGRSLTVHGWIYRLTDGLLKDLLKKPVTSLAEARGLQNR